MNYRVLRALKPSIIQTIIEHEVMDTEVLKEELKSCRLIVDAIFGTGLKGEVKGLMKDAILAVNESNKEVISIDIPSGIDGDTGKYHGAASKGRKYQH